jgi:hypothetical protein
MRGTALDWISPEPSGVLYFDRPVPNFRDRRKLTSLCSVISKMNSFLCLFFFSLWHTILEEQCAWDG